MFRKRKAYKIEEPPENLRELQKAKAITNEIVQTAEAVLEKATELSQGFAEERRKNHYRERLLLAYRGEITQSTTGESK